MVTITIKQLHARTGEEVRKAGKSRSPVAVTDRGKLVALLTSPLPQGAASRRRTLLRDYATLLAKSRSHDVLEDLAAVRGDR